MSPVCAAPLDLATLLDDWLGDLTRDADEAIDEHVISCAACAGQLDALVALGAGVRRLAYAGGVWAVVPGAFVERLVDEGLRVRQYRLAPGGRVQCTVAASDEVVAARRRRRAAPRRVHVRPHAIAVVGSLDNVAARFHNRRHFPRRSGQCRLTSSS
jgi:hypothetical protein